MVSVSILVNTSTKVFGIGVEIKIVVSSSTRMGMGMGASQYLASSPGRFFANITAGEKYGLVLIVSACALF